MIIVVDFAVSCVLPVAEQNASVFFSNFHSSAFLIGTQETLRLVREAEKLSQDPDTNREIVSPLTVSIEKNVKKSQRVFYAFHKLMASIFC